MVSGYDEYKLPSVESTEWKSNRLKRERDGRWGDVRKNIITILGKKLQYFIEVWYNISIKSLARLWPTPVIQTHQNMILFNTQFFLVEKFNITVTQVLCPENLCVQ